MENNNLQRLLSRKSVIIGIAVILLASFAFLFLEVNQSRQPAPEPTPSPAQQVTPETSENMWPSVQPDKEIEGQIIVQFKPEYTDAQINERLKQYDASIINTIEGINTKVLKVPAGQEDAIMERLRNDPYVQSAEQDTTNHIMYTPNDTNYNLQYGLKNIGQAIQNITGTANADVKAEAAWDVTRGNGIKVAILDTGIQTNHPDLSGKVIASKFFTTTTVEDSFGHGTHVAGIIAATTNNSAGVAGTCPDCQLIIGKVMDDTGSGSTSNIASGITWAADQGAQVINLSLGSVQASSKTTYQTAINYATQKGAIVVAAAGNCGGTNFSSNGCTAQNQISYPGANDGVITVGSTDNKDVKSTFSNYGTHVEVTAPGTNIVSTVPGSKYAYKSGTSMATPMVVGVVALIKAANPNASASDVTNKLYSTADKITGTGQYWTQGRVNAAKAVGASTVTPTTTAPTTVTPTYVCGGSGTGNVCPPTPSSAPTIFISPTISVGPGTIAPSNTQPTINPGTTVQPTISSGPIGGGGGGGSTPCRSLNQMTYNRSYKSGGQQERIKAHVKNDTNVQGFLDRFFEFIFRLIELIFRIIGIQTPCLINPPIGSPGNPTPVPGGGTPGVNPNPTTNPTATLVPSVSASPGASIVPSNNPNPGTSPGVSTVPPVGGGGGGSPQVSTVPPVGGGGGGGNPPTATQGGQLPPPVSGGGSGGGGGGTAPNPNTPNPQGYNGQCKPEDAQNGFSYCFGDGPNSGKCLPPAGECNAPTQPYPDGEFRSLYCTSKDRQEYLPPAGGAARGICKVCPKGATVKQGATACTCDQAGFVPNADKTLCVRQIQGCKTMTPDNKCSECTSSSQQPAPDGLSCVAKPAPPVNPNPGSGGGGGGTGGNTCVVYPYGGTSCPAGQSCSLNPTTNKRTCVAIPSTGGGDTCVVYPYGGTSCPAGQSCSLNPTTNKRSCVAVPKIQRGQPCVPSNNLCDAGLVCMINPSNGSGYVCQ